MKTPSFKKLGTMACLAVSLTAPLGSLAQSYIVDFSSSLGSGSFTFDITQLTPYFSDAHRVFYNDPTGTATFNGAATTGLSLIVYNNMPLYGQPNYDGFDIAASPNYLINVYGTGNSSIIDDTTPSDFLTAIESFSQQTAGLYLIRPTDDFSTPLAAFSIAETPEPSSVALLGSAATLAALSRYRFKKPTVSMR